jgi:formylglycine-generating enzyme required for sulfatase activity/tRNA A-37 threonylcarbamoyl transferase component Bud32
MNCPNCGSTYPDGDAACRMCGHPLTPAASMVATSAMTPPEGLIPSGPGPELVDELAQRLQAVIGENYKIEKTLGAGGFAVVYLARDIHLKRRLAVKVLSPDLVSSKTVLERFRREAETVAQLSHPHIVPLHFIGQKDDLLYLAMECIDGGSLADWIEREGKLPTADVIRIICEVASALNYAHKRGVIHRDIKPQNVLIEADTGRTLVTDFGIARTAEGSSLTASGMLVGTPAYLSPEQVTGSPTDHRADIYALGVMSYEMLTGQPPFTGPTPTAVLLKRLSEAPTPIAKLRPDAPQVLRDVIDGMLAQNPDERFQSGAEIVRALGGATPVSGHHGTAEIVMRNRRKKKALRNLWISVGLGAVLGVAALSWALVGRSGKRTTVAAVDSGMVLIAAGKYTIGSDSGLDIVQPAHEVQLAAFGLDSLEVSVADYARFVTATGALAPWGDNKPDERLPVTRVLFSEAGSYCFWRHKDGGGRLPTEDEWEAAARGTEGRLYPWGNVPQMGWANTANAQRPGPAPVGSFPQGRTPLGVHDLVGNAWEWTSSRYAAYPGGHPISVLGLYYVVRGGAFNTRDQDASAILRGAAKPTTGDRAADLPQTGFRCAMPARAVRR